MGLVFETLILVMRLSRFTSVPEDLHWMHADALLMLFCRSQFMLEI